MNSILCLCLPRVGFTGINNCAQSNPDISNPRISNEADIRGVAGQGGCWAGRTETFMEDRQEEPLPGQGLEPLGLLLMWRLWWTVVRDAWPVDTCACSVGHGISKTEGLALESADSTNEELQAPPPGSTYTSPVSAKTQFSILD